MGIHLQIVPALPLVLTTVAAADEILASGYFTDAIVRYDADTGAPLGALGAGLDGAIGFVRGPDGHVYACSELTDAVLRFTWPGGALIDTFVAPGHGLNGPTACVFGPDLTGDGRAELFVASFESDAVLLYDGITGAFVDTFVTAGLGGLNGPDVGMAFGPDGNLYVPSYWSNSVICYDGADGSLIGVVIPAGGDLSRPRTIAWRADGRMLVTSEGNGRVNVYEPDGTPVGPLVVGVSSPSGLALEPGGTMLVTSVNGDSVRRYDAMTGALVGIVVAPGAGGLDAPTCVRLEVRGDVNGDHRVGVPDLLAVLSAWGDCPALPAGCRADLDGDGAVGVGDVLIVLGAWD